MEVCDSLTALSVENGLSPSPSDTAPSQQPALHPEHCHGRGCGTGKGVKEKDAWSQGRGWAAVDPVPLWLPAHGCKALGGIMNPASITTSLQHFIHQLAFFANFKHFFTLIGRIKMSLPQWGTLVIGSRWFVLGLYTSSIWEAIKNFKHPAMF